MLEVSICVSVCNFLCIFHDQYDPGKMLHVMNLMEHFDKEPVNDNEKPYILQ